MPKRRTAAQFEAAKSSWDPPERAKYGDDNSWWDAQHEWVVKDPVGISEHVAPRGHLQRRKDWQRITKEHAAILADPALQAAYSSAAASSSPRTSR